MIDTLTIGPYPYRVTRDRNELLEAEKRQGKSLLGECSTDTLTIVIASGPLAVMRATLVHEILHALADYVNLGLEEDEEERVVTTLAPALLDTLRRNPDLVAYLTG